MLTETLRDKGVKQISLGDLKLMLCELTGKDIQLYVVSNNDSEDTDLNFILNAYNTKVNLEAFIFYKLPEYESYVSGVTRRFYYYWSGENNLVLAVKRIKGVIT